MAQGRYILKISNLARALLEYIHHEVYYLMESLQFLSYDLMQEAFEVTVFTPTYLNSPAVQ